MTTNTQNDQEYRADAVVSHLRSKYADSIITARGVATDLDITVDDARSMLSYAAEHYHSIDQVDEIYVVHEDT